MPHVEARWSEDQLVAAIRREKHSGRRDRLRVVLWALRGETAEAIAARLGRGTTFVKRWIARWNAEGPDGLTSRPHTGRPRRLPAQSERALADRIAAGPDPARDGPLSAFTGEDVRTILEREFGVVYTLAGAYRVLHRLGLEWLVPRPRHPGTDEEAQRQWRETTAPLLSGRPANSTPAGPSNCGTRTRRGSARRAR